MKENARFLADDVSCCTQPIYLRDALKVTPSSMHQPWADWWPGQCTAAGQWSVQANIVIQAAQSIINDRT